MFNKITLSQWLWYAAQFAADEKDKFELLRDIAEHNASFWNPEGVSQVRKGREQTFAVTDKDFAKQLEETFGRKLDVVTKEHHMPVKQELNANPYLETELDDIRFIPNR
jgi:hypothetical protein